MLCSGVGIVMELMDHEGKPAMESRPMYMHVGMQLHRVMCIILYSVLMYT